MNKYLKISITVLMVFSLVLGFITLSLKSSSSGSANIVEAKKNKILSCLGTNKTGFIELPGIKICIDKALSGDTGVADAVISNKAFMEAQKVNPLTFTFCHKNMHDLAHKVPSQEVFNVLKMTNWNSCQWGFLHGLLEDAAVGNESRFFKPIIELCNSWTDMRDRSECAHSVGHGAWNSTQDTTKSIRLCQNFSRYYDKQLCSMGMFMQTYWATSGTPSSKFDLNPVVMLDKCVGLTGETRDLCIDSVANSFSLYYRKKTSKIRDFIALSMNENERLPQEILDKITYYAETEKKICNVFSAKDKSRCYDNLWSTAPDFDGPAYTRSDSMHALCKAFPDKYKECMLIGIGVKNYWASKKVYSY